MSKQLVATIVGNSNYDESYSSKTKHYSQRMVCGLPQQCLICGLYLRQILQWIWYFLFTVSGRETDSLSWIDELKDILQHVLLQTLSILTHWDLVGHPWKIPCCSDGDMELFNSTRLTVEFESRTLWRLSFVWLDDSGQIIATSHDRFPPKGSFLEGKSPYFRQISVGESL